MDIKPEVLEQIKKSTTDELYVKLENLHEEMEANKTAKEQYTIQEWKETYTFKREVILELQRRDLIDDQLFSDLHFEYGILSTYQWWN